MLDDAQVWKGAYGEAEGIVIRTLDRKWIRKLRIEDYEKVRRGGTSDE